MAVVPEHKNDMGTKFNVIVEKLKIPVTHDKFLSNVITLHKDNLIEFIKEVAHLRSWMIGYYDVDDFLSLIYLNLRIWYLKLKYN